MTPCTSGANRAFDILSALTRRAGCGHPLKGSVKVGDDLIPILDLRYHPGLMASPVAPDRRIAVVDLAGRVTGMIIGVALETIAPFGLEPVSAEDLPHSLASEEIVGAVRVGRRLLVGLAAKSHSGEDSSDSGTIP
jgi:hypothetical protein